MANSTNSDEKLSQYSQYNDSNPELSSPKTFAEFISDGKWKSAPHLDYINEKLLKLSYNEINKLIVNMPPRHGKSEFISCYYLLWYAMKFPMNNVIFVSYNNVISSFFGKKLISLIEANGEKYGVKISKRSKSSKEFSLMVNNLDKNEIDKNENNNKGKQGGTYTFTGIGGSLTGKGAQLIIIDDPIKNNTDAFSYNKRNSIWEWYQSTLFTRLEPNSAIIVVMTRWHKDDICGKLFALSENLKQKYNAKNQSETQSETLSEKTSEKQIAKSTWETVILSAIADEKDMIGRQKGSVLWKDRYNLNDLLEIKGTLGEYWFSAMYQQNPQFEDGEVFKKEHFRYYEEINGVFITNTGLINQEKFAPNNCTYYITIDLAISTKAKADYTVLLVFAVSPENKIFIVDIFREKVSPTKHLDIIKNYYIKYKPYLIGIEKVQYQTALIEEAIKHGLPIKELIPKGIKTVRALPIAARMSSGIVYFKSNSIWLDEFENELLNFPSCEHDDQVDAFSYISQMIEIKSSNNRLASSGNKSKISEGFI